MDTLRLFRQWPSIRFHYGTMEAGKSLQLLIAAHELKQKLVEYRVISVVPDKDVHASSTVVSSRSGLPPHDAKIIDCHFDLSFYTFAETDRLPITHLLIDEAQFLTKNQVAELRMWVESDPSHRVDCYGLKTDFKGEFFPGSLELMQCADELIEVPSLCSRCTRPATHNMRLDKSGTAIVSGDQVALKETTTYVSVCYRCWHTTILITDLCRVECRHNLA